MTNNLPDIIRPILHWKPWKRYIHVDFGASVLGKAVKDVQVTAVFEKVNDEFRYKGALDGENAYLFTREEVERCFEQSPGSVHINKLIN